MTMEQPGQAEAYVLVGGWDMGNDALCDSKELAQLEFKDDIRRHSSHRNGLKTRLWFFELHVHKDSRKGAGL